MIYFAQLSQKSRSFVGNNVFLLLTSLRMQSLPPCPSPPKLLLFKSFFNTIKLYFKYFHIFHYFLVCIFTVSYKINIYFSYGGRRLYQYNEDDFDFNFVLYQSFQQHGYTNRMETKSNCNYKASLLLLVNS